MIKEDKTGILPSILPILKKPIPKDWIKRETRTESRVLFVQQLAILYTFLFFQLFSAILFVLFFLVLSFLINLVAANTFPKSEVTLNVRIVSSYHPITDHQDIDFTALLSRLLFRMKSNLGMKLYAIFLFIILPIFMFHKFCGRSRDFLWYQTQVYGYKYNRLRQITTRKIREILMWP